MRAKPKMTEETAAGVTRKQMEDFTPVFPFPSKTIDPTEAAKRDAKDVMNKYRKELEEAVEKAVKK
jgi:hypothetical protein